MMRSGVTCCMQASALSGSSKWSTITPGASVRARASSKLRVAFWASTISTRSPLPRLRSGAALAADALELAGKGFTVNFYC